MLNSLKLAYWAIKTIWRTHRNSDKLSVLAANMSRCDDCTLHDTCELHHDWMLHLIEHGEQPDYVTQPTCLHCGEEPDDVQYVNENTAIPSCCETETHPDIL